MPVWSGGDLAVYHGTDTFSLGLAGLVQGQQVNFVVQLPLCRPATDFGRGFYTTTSQHQARQWANAKVRRVSRRNQTLGLVLKFNVDRDRLAALQSLVFVRAIQDFWDFVSHCRNGGLVHNRGGRRRSYRGNAGYDVVYGPVTIWPSLLLIQDCDQVSFHTNAAIGILSQTPQAADVAILANGGFF
jgi:hypothetical protein